MGSKLKEDISTLLETEQDRISYRGAFRDCSETALLSNEKDAGRIHAVEKYEKHLSEAKK